jgi:NADH dehydrogenase [ubiquinone] 1 alpha subcomplex assembly factor 5
VNKTFARGFVRSSSTVQVFNRELKQQHRERALNLEDGNYYDYLREESASNIVDRIEDITRSFPKALEIGSYRGSIHSIIASRENFRGSGGVGGITELTQAELAPITNATPHPNASDIVPALVAVNSVKVDEEQELPFADDTYDLVLSNLSLHWVNDLPAALLQIKRVLKPDGAFVASILGGDTLQELRNCMYVAEKERRGRATSRASPMAKASDVAALMQGAGFALPTVDIDKVTVSNPYSIAIEWDLVLFVRLPTAEFTHLRCQCLRAAVSTVLFLCPVDLSPPADKLPQRHSPDGAPAAHGRGPGDLQQAFGAGAGLLTGYGGVVPR